MNAKENEARETKVAGGPKDRAGPDRPEAPGATFPTPNSGPFAFIRGSPSGAFIRG
jgi:hypothetical protein